MNALTDLMVAERPAAGPRNMVFAGALVALALGLLQQALVGPLLLDRIQATLPQAAGTISVMLWAGTVFAPLLFLVVALVTAAGTWSIGAFLDEPASYQTLLNVCAVAELARTVGMTVTLAAARVGWLSPDGRVMASLVGSAYAPQETMWLLASRGLMSPAAWVWAIALGLLLRRWGGWSRAGAVVAPIAALVFRAIAVAIRNQHSFLAS